MHLGGERHFYSQVCRVAYCLRTQRFEPSQGSNPNTLLLGRAQPKIRLATAPHLGRRGGLMVSALDSGASGLGSSPGQGQCVVFLGKTLYSHSASLHPGE